MAGRRTADIARTKSKWQENYCICLGRLLLLASLGNPFSAALDSMLSTTANPHSLDVSGRSWAHMLLHRRLARTVLYYVANPSTVPPGESSGPLDTSGGIMQSDLMEAAAK